MPRTNRFIPHARSKGLVITDLDDELLVYDKERDKAHCLNQTAALVWRYSNGKRNVADIAQRMENKLHSPVDVQIVWFALQQLQKDHLLQNGAALPNEFAGISRREFVKQMGKVAVAVAVPIVISMTAPTSALAVSCLPQGTCITNPATGCLACCSQSCIADASCTALGSRCL